MSPLDTKLDSAQMIANENNESRAQVFRYIRLTYLIPELLEEVDKKRIAFRPAKESGKVEDFIIQCVEEHNKRERLRQERNAR